MVSGLAATRLLATLVPSMMKMEVAPVSAMAWLGAIVTALMTAGEIARNDACVVKSRDNFFGGGMCDLFDVTIVTVSLSSADCHGVFLVGSEEGLYAETKLICLFAKLLVFAPHRQVLRPNGSTVLCIPRARVHGSYPTAMNCCAFSRTNDVW
jgi:hypothetical protein